MAYATTPGLAGPATVVMEDVGLGWVSGAPATATAGWAPEGAGVRPGRAGVDGGAAADGAATPAATNGRGDAVSAIVPSTTEGVETSNGLAEGPDNATMTGLTAGGASGRGPG